MTFLLALLIAPTGLNVRDFGAKGDLIHDDAPAFQAALNKASEGVGELDVPPGNYLFKESIQVPKGVAIQGSWLYVPSHTGIRDAGELKPTDGGTTFCVEVGRGTTEGAFLTLNSDSGLRGVVVYYPLQHDNDVPDPYPFAIAMRGNNATVENVELLNPYQGIDATGAARHLIRNVQGQPLLTGIFVDQIYDIGRIENVHFNPWWSMKPKLLDWQMSHGQAFVFGRTDWQYVLNTFCFGYKTGYRFVHTKQGDCNGNFVGIGADDCWTSVDVEQSAPFGILISNGEFTSFHGPDPTEIRVEPTHTGVVRFLNCAFWGPCHQIASISGSGTVALTDCTFVQWDRDHQGKAAIQVDGGSVIVRGCDFQQNLPAVHLGASVKQAVIEGNISPQPLVVQNESKGRVEVGP